MGLIVARIPRAGNIRHTRPARVLLVANNFPPVRGGSAVVYANLARWAQDRLIVVAPFISYSLGMPLIGWREHDRRQPYRVIRLPLLRTRMGPGPAAGLGRLVFRALDAAIRLRLAALLFWLIATAGVRTVCVGELLASSWIIQLFRFVPGIRTVAYVHGEEITTEDRYDPEHVRGRRALQHSDAIIVVSRFTQQAVLDLLGKQSVVKVSLLENGVDGARFHPGPRAADLIELYRLEGCFVFVSVCRLLEKKGVDNAIRAFANVVRQHPQSRYLVVGTGPYADTLRDLAAQLQLSEQVVFVGQVAEDDLAEHYRLGDVFIMPNRELPNGDTEGFGLVFLEANSCGLPVIAGRDGGSTDAVQDGGNGLVVDGHSVDEIAGAMLRLLQDPDLRTKLRAQGLTVAARAGWAEKTRAFLAICLGTTDAQI
jgi:phosphatidylinositol alpha-1,6-mannosyltransferase